VFLQLDVPVWLPQIEWDSVLFSESSGGEECWAFAEYILEHDAVLCASQSGDLCLVSVEDATHTITSVGWIEDVRRVGCHTHVA